VKYFKIVTSAVFLLSLSVGVANAQESDGSGKYHPFLSSTFQIGLGVYAPTKKNRIGVNADVDDDNLQQSIDGTEKQTTGMLDFRWRYAENWSFEANLWDTRSDTRNTLNEDRDFTFNGKDFQLKKGSFIGSGLDTSIARLFWGRSFYRTPSTDWGVGLGLHWMEIEAYVEGQISVAAGGGGTEFQREDSSVSAPLPNLGIWYMYSWSPNWVLITRLDWLDVTFKEYSGRMLDASVGVNYQMSDHFGVGLAVNAFDLNVSVDGERWGGDVGTRQYGPRLNLTWNW
jgi:hypothetical protein